MNKENCIFLDYNRTFDMANTVLAQFNSKMITKGSDGMVVKGKLMDMLSAKE